MFQRVRRSTHFQVEKLEGRAIPSIVIDYAHVISIHPQTVVISGYTTFPTEPGQILEITAIERLPGSHRTIEGEFPRHFVVARPNNPDYSGRFLASIHAPRGEHWVPGGTMKVVAENITSLSRRYVIDRGTVSHLPIHPD
jgi:hypothetical protein